MKFIKKHLFIIIPIVIFILLIFPYLGKVPYLDGSIDVAQIKDYMKGGMSEYIMQWPGVHPPFKVVLFSFVFSVFGKHLLAYSLPGVVLGIASIISIWHLVYKLSDKTSAAIAALLLSSCPLLLSNTPFSQTDFIVACMVIISFTLYIYNRKILFMLAMTIAVMTKETAVLLPIAIILIELTFGLLKVITKNKSYKINQINIFMSLVPIIAFTAWWLYLKSYNKEMWGQFIFTPNPEQGTFNTILENIFTLKLFNKYALQNWGQLFFLNFNWVIYLILFLGCIYFLIKFNRIHVFRLLISDKRTINKYKTFTGLIVFFLLYILIVLSFQTYTITRYGLPAHVIAILFYAIVITKLGRLNKPLLIALIIVVPIVNYLSLYRSVDPVSRNLWGHIKICDEEFIALNLGLAGNDGIIYNLQAMDIVAQRDEAIIKANINSDNVYFPSCAWIHFHEDVMDFLEIKKLNLNCI